MSGLNQTHDPARRSWVESANDPDQDFPIQNLPFGAFSTDGGSVHIGAAIGDRILDLTVLEECGLVCPANDSVFASGVLNPFMALPQEVWTRTRRQIADLLDSDSALQGEVTEAVKDALVPMQAAQMHLPFFARSFTDFYASKEHATNVGAMFRDPDNALLPNWLHMPIGYNGRASTVVVSGTPIHRPNGQLKVPSDAVPRFGPSEKLDFELELGAVVGTPNAMGQPITTSAAFQNIFGYVLLNDWSARDIQQWEYQPLGPFMSKAFATTISPWVVTREALEPFRTDTPDRETPLLPYLHENTPNNFEIQMDVALRTNGADAVNVAHTNSKHLYYSSAQQLAHHTSSGCAMETGDLLGSGTISGSTPDSFGSMLELTSNGRTPLRLGDKRRSFLENGDEVIITGHAKGKYRVGFGECRGTVFQHL